MAKFEYEVIKEEEDSNFSTIVKRNVEVEFTMSELREHEHQVLRVLKESESKLEMEKATMQNVEHNHGDAVALVKDIDPLKQHALLIWLKSHANVLELEPRVKEISDALESHKEEVKDIQDQIGWVAPVAPAPEAEEEKEDKEEK